jgi:hypothetical protein
MNRLSGTLAGVGHPNDPRRSRTISDRPFDLLEQRAREFSPPLTFGLRTTAGRSTREEFGCQGHHASGSGEHTLEDSERGNWDHEYQAEGQMRPRTRSSPQVRLVDEPGRLLYVGGGLKRWRRWERRASVAHGYASKVFKMQWCPSGSDELCYQRYDDHN